MTNQKITLSVSEMHCPSCPKIIQITLSETAGVISVESSLEKKEVLVEFDPVKTNAKLLIAAIEEIGYKASLK